MDFEKNILQKVINNTLKKKNKYLKIIKKNDSKLLIKSIFFKDFVNYNTITEKFLFQSSTLFFPFVKKIIKMLQYPCANKLSFIMQKIVDEVLITGSRIENDELKIYFRKILNYFCQKCLEFDDFLKKYDSINHNHYMKEYFIATFVPMMLYPIGKIKNWELYEKILKIWIVSDNIADCSFIDKKIAKKIIEEVEIFFTEELFLSDCTQFFLIEGNPIIDCLRDIWLLDINDWIKLKIFQGLRKLYYFSYSVEGKKKDIESISEINILEKTCVKAKISIDIFSLALDLNEEVREYIDGKKWNEDFMLKYYNLSLSIQLLDDLLDIRKDIDEKCQSVFTNYDKNNCLAYSLIIDNIFSKYGGEIRYYFKVLQTLFMSYNGIFFPEGVKEEIDNNIKFINLKVYNMEIIFDLMNDREFMISCYKAYLQNNIMDFDLYKTDYVLEEIQKIVDNE